VPEAMRFAPAPAEPVEPVGEGSTDPAPGPGGEIGERSGTDADHEIEEAA
jgi:hypothetical protein